MRRDFVGEGNKRREIFSVNSICKWIFIWNICNFSPCSCHRDKWIRFSNVKLKLLHEIWQRSSEKFFCPGMTACDSPPQKRVDNFIKFCVREKFEYNFSTPNFS